MGLVLAVPTAGVISVLLGYARATRDRARGLDAIDVRARRARLDMGVTRSTHGGRGNLDWGGDRPVRDVLAGSVSRRVAAGAHCPVMVSPRGVELATEALMTDARSATPVQSSA